MIVATTLLAGCATGGRLPEIAPHVHGELFTPVQPGPHPAVVVLHGLGGMRPVYLDEAKHLAEHGYVALVLDYYGDLRPTPLRPSERARRWNAWQDAVLAGVAHLRTLPDVDRERIAVVGFSQGAGLALTTAHRIPDLKALIDYFGPEPESWFVRRYSGFAPRGHEEALTKMPPVLALHGAWDPIVPAVHSRRLTQRLRQLGREVDLHIYPQTLHSFNDADSGLSNSTRTADDARGRVLKFLDEHLKDDETASEGGARE